MRAVFLDRDGVISVNRPDHVKSWDEFEFIPGALSALARLHQAGQRVFVVTNQAAVNRGLLSTEALADIHDRMLREVERHGGYVEGVISCPHRPEEGCYCRKPHPGMLLYVQEHYKVTLQGSYMVGDALSDVDAGSSVGCHTALVMTGRGQAQHRWACDNGRTGYAVLDDLSASVEYILHREANLLRVRPTRREGITNPPLTATRSVAPVVGG